MGMFFSTQAADHVKGNGKLSTKKITIDDFNAIKFDGVIDFNKMISRSHCRINKRGGQYTITDLQSANGTYVNKVKLQPNQPHPISNGDVIRLANSDFQVNIG